MALSLVGPNLVWQTVRIYTAGNNEATYQGAAAVLKALKAYLSTQKKNPQLQVVAIDGSVSSSDGSNTASQVLANAACRLYALVLKKSGTTACWFKGSDHASTAGTDGTQVISAHDANAVTGDELIQLFLDGKSLANGLTVTMNTTATGSTLTLKANRFDGFAIIGAP